MSILNQKTLNKASFSNINSIKDVLEPSCGSCEYILNLNNINPNIHITGIELNKTIFESIKQYESDNSKNNCQS